MNTTKPQVMPAPPSPMKALTAGFDAISNHFELILFSVGLDLLLWMGPHLRLTSLIQSIVGWVTAWPGMDSPEMAQVVELYRETGRLAAEQFNLLSFLRTVPVGVPSLMAGRMPSTAPYGQPYALDVSSDGFVLLVWLGVCATGLLVTALYFSVVAQATLSGQVNWRRAVRDLPWSLSQMILLTLVWFGLLVLISFPFACVLSFAFLGGAGFSSLLLILYAALLFWAILPLIFVPHGIFAARRPIWSAVLDSLRITRYHRGKMIWFLLTVWMLGQGLDLLWKIPADTSWLALVDVAGHAFVTTALLAATFIYYRDALQWIQAEQQQAG